MSLRSVRLILLATAALLLTPSAASAAWTVTPTPNPGGPTNLRAVDCSSANSCIAVGDGIPAGNRPLPVAERWDGTSWQLTPAPPLDSLGTGSLGGVSCPRPNVCFAVGAGFHPLI